MNEPQLIRDDLKALESHDPVADLLRDFEDDMFDLPIEVFDDDAFLLIKAICHGDDRVCKPGNPEQWVRNLAFDFAALAPTTRMADWIPLIEQEVQRIAPYVMASKVRPH